MLRIAFSQHPEVQVIGEAADGAVGLALALDVEPDVVVLDLAMPELDGFQVARRLRAKLPGCRILIFSTHEAERAEAAALAAGADRYVEKGAGFAAAAKLAVALAVNERS